MDIFEFEEKYKSTLEDIEEWAYLRIAVGFYLKNQNNNIKVTKLTFSQKLKNKFKVIQQYKNIFYGFRNWFRNYDYLFFSDSLERRYVNNLYKDKILDNIIKKLNNYSSLMIESPISSHYKINEVETDFIVSRSLLNLFSKLVISKDIKKDFSKLKNILKSNNIEINIDKTLKKFQAEYIVYKILFKFYKPKGVFINCAYCQIVLSKIANDLGIKVIEIQHGVINSNHFGYSSKLNFDSKYSPAFLLSWGDDILELEDNIISKIYPIGNFYLGYIKNNFIYNNNIEKITKDYKVIIGISLQDEEASFVGMINFIKEVSLLNKDILYILIPRKRDDFYNLPKNVVQFKNIDCYNIIQHCDIHMTIYSSCCLETPFLGIPNILIDVNGLANKYYGKNLNKYYTKIISTIQYNDKIIENLLHIDKNKMLNLHKSIIVDNYDNNLTNFIKKEIQI